MNIRITKYFPIYCSQPYQQFVSAAPLFELPLPMLLKKLQIIKPVIPILAGDFCR